MQKATGKKKKKKQSPVLILGIVVVAVLLILYMVIAVYFRDRFLFRTEVNGKKAGGRTVEEIEEKLALDVEDYLLTIYDRDGNKYHIMGRDIGCTYMEDGAVQKAQEAQNMLAWLPALFKGESIEVNAPMTYDSDMLENAVSSLACFQEENIVKPVNAYIRKSGSAYEIVPEVPGSQMIPEKVRQLIEESVQKGMDTLMLTDEVYVAPEITKDAPILTDKLAEIDACLNAEIQYVIADYEEILDKETIQNMVEIDENLNITISDEEVAKYAQYLASKYNTYGDVRQFKTTAGNTVPIGGGDYGWVVDKEKEAAQIKLDIMSGQPVRREPIYSQRAKVEGFEDIGDTYVEIDYSEQHMWYYEEGELVLESDIVSGNIALGNGSPDGIYKVVYKKSPAVLTGEDYESNVDYFIVFAYNVGIHDASWRTEFGGEYYRTAGSHGCVNAPGDAAATLFERIEVDTPVVAYYREAVELTAENCRISNAFSYVAPAEETE